MPSDTLSRSLVNSSSISGVASGKWIERGFSRQVGIPLEAAKRSGSWDVQTKLGLRLLGLAAVGVSELAVMLWPMDLDLVGRRALITGSSGGIGAAIAMRLAGEGCSVVVHGRDSRAAGVVADSMVDVGGSVSTVLGDLADPVQARAVCEDALADGVVDILVANAGPFAEHRFFDADDVNWMESFTGNVLSAIRCIRHLAGPMRERGWGRVVTVGTRGVVMPLPNMVEYSAAKAALSNATVGLAQELAGSGVTANIVSPGVMLTDGLREMFIERARRAGDYREWEEIEPEMTRNYAPNPAGRLGHPEDVANVVAFLVSPLADYVTGSTIRVDGGITGTANP